MCVFMHMLLLGNVCFLLLTTMTPEEGYGEGNMGFRARQEKVK